MDVQTPIVMNGMPVGTVRLLEDVAREVIRTVTHVDAPVVLVPHIRSNVEGPEAYVLDSWEVRSSPIGPGPDDDVRDIVARANRLAAAARSVALGTPFEEVELELNEALESWEALTVAAELEVKQPRLEPAPASASVRDTAESLARWVEARLTAATGSPAAAAHDAATGIKLVRQLWELLPQEKSFENVLRQANRRADKAEERARVAELNVEGLEHMVVLQRERMVDIGMLQPHDEANGWKVMSTSRAVGRGYLERVIRFVKPLDDDEDDGWDAVAAAREERDEPRFAPGDTVDVYFVFAPVPGKPDLVFVETELHDGLGTGVGTWDDHPTFPHLKRLRVPVDARALRARPATKLHDVLADEAPKDEHAASPADEVFAAWMAAAGRAGDAFTEALQAAVEALRTERGL